MARDSIKDGRKGSFRTRSNGRIEYRFRYIDEFGSAKVKSISGADQKECIRRADEWIHIYKESVKGFDQNTTIPEILRKKYEKDKASNLLSESGLRTNLFRTKILERSVLGSIPIALIDKNDIEMFGFTITDYSNSVIQAVYMQLGCWNTMKAVTLNLRWIRWRIIIRKRFPMDSELFLNTEMCQ